jgi:hypothetical protein
MFNNLFKTKYNTVSFEDVQSAILKPATYIIINTMSATNQNCLIKTTISYQGEENLINEYINNYDFSSKTFIIYGENTNDDSIETKFKQMQGLGFANVYIYRGGMFEWLLLQDIYGQDEFPTTSKLLDILKYKPTRTWNN